jgi:hypothetical protein
MIDALRRTLGRLRRRDDGSTLLEFAFVAPVLMILLFGGMEVGMIFFADSLLEGGLREASRFGLTGAPPPSGTREDHIVEVVNANGAGVVVIDETNITTLVYPNFTSIGEPEPFTDSNGNLVYDASEPFVDINCNSQWDPDMGKSGLGHGGEVVKYSINYELPLLSGLLAPLLGTDGKFPLAASVVVRNEPFDDGDPAC